MDPAGATELSLCGGGASVTTITAPERKAIILEQRLLLSVSIQLG